MRGGHAGFGVSGGGGGVAVGAAEISLAVDQRIAEVPVLGHPHERGIDDRFAVRVIVAAGIADDLGALVVLGPGPRRRSFIGTRIRRWDGLSPSRTSGSGRSMMVLIA